MVVDENDFTGDFRFSSVCMSIYPQNNWGTHPACSSLKLKFLHYQTVLVIIDAFSELLMVLDTKFIGLYILEEIFFLHI